MLPQLASSGPATINEGNRGTTLASFSLTLTRNGFAGFVPFSWSNSGSGANPADASDFPASALPIGSGTFLPGETTKTITVPIAGDEF